MSEFHVEVARVRNVQKHPNADTLSIAEINGYPVIFRTGEFSEGGLAAYVPIDSVVPDTEDWAFLGGHRRIKAKRLRGIFSMGLIIPAKPEWKLGQNVQDELGIEKYEPPVNIVMGSENERDPGFLPVFTDIEGLRRWPDVLSAGEEVVLTEKIHGANGRFLYKEGRLWVGSHTNIKRRSHEFTVRTRPRWLPRWLFVGPMKYVFGKRTTKMTPEPIWWEIATASYLEEKLRAFPDIAIYGEVYGQVQDLKYGVERGAKLVLFDALDTTTMKYLNYDEFQLLAAKLGLKTTPELYRGPWKKDLVCLAEGKSILGGDHVREGFVVRPVCERWDARVGRVIFKMLGEGYLLRKAA